eukprot:632459-Lingulodinium_polyedra.AAC.1
MDIYNLLHAKLLAPERGRQCLWPGGNDEPPPTHEPHPVPLPPRHAHSERSALCTANGSVNSPTESSPMAGSTKSSAAPAHENFIALKPVPSFESNLNVKMKPGIIALDGVSES